MLYNRRLKPFLKTVGKVNFGNLAAPKQPMETFDEPVVKRKTPEAQPLFFFRQNKRRANSC
jgi:hypothetical protein